MHQLRVVAWEIAVMCGTMPRAHARLFPEIARRMREQTFALQREDGGLPFRHSDRHFETQGPAIDGMLGDILSTYREYLCSSDQQWLHAHWSSAREGDGFCDCAVGFR